MKNVGVWMKHGVGMMCVVGLTGLGCLAGCTDNDAIVETMCLCKDVSPRAAEVKVVEVKRQECVPSVQQRTRHDPRVRSGSYPPHTAPDFPR